jgi:hypothetical protein
MTREYPLFPSENGPAPLLDHVQQVKRRDFADEDVRNAVRSVAANENKHRIASELGLDGVGKMESWDRRISEAGPHAAIEAAQLYASQPRLPAAQEKDRNEGDHEKSARAAYWQTVEKERREGHMPATLSALDRLEQRHGSLGVVDTFKRWDQQLRENPHDASARVATEIHNRIVDAQGMQHAANQVNGYLAQHRVSDDERAVMQRVLASGEMQDLPSAHAFARYQLAYDVKDGHARDVEAARREREGVEMYHARLIAAEWEQRHPNVNYAVRSKMKALLSEGKARDLDSAYAMARR